MLTALKPEAQELARYMSELSEQAYNAGWMAGLEFELWHVVENGPRAYGHLLITDKYICELRRLSEAAHGWIVFDDESEEILLPIEQWKERFEAWARGIRH